MFQNIICSKAIFWARCDLVELCAEIIRFTYVRLQLKERHYLYPPEHVELSHPPSCVAWGQSLVYNPVRVITVLASPRRVAPGKQVLSSLNTLVSIPTKFQERKKGRKLITFNYTQQRRLLSRKLNTVVVCVKQGWDTLKTVRYRKIYKIIEHSIPVHEIFVIFQISQFKPNIAKLHLGKEAHLHRLCL